MHATLGELFRFGLLAGWSVQKNIKEWARRTGAQMLTSW
jgi:hypothetical protein